MTTYISHADTNKLIRKALKEAFPTVKFSVKKRHGSTNVSWTDGPTETAVKELVAIFEGSTFDGMTDYKGGCTAIDQDGNEVHFMADFIFVNRDHSDTHMQNAINATWNKFQMESEEKPTLEEYNNTLWSTSQDDLNLIRKNAHKRTRVLPMASKTAESFTYGSRY